MLNGGGLGGGYLQIHGRWYHLGAPRRARAAPDGLSGRIGIAFGGPQPYYALVEAKENGGMYRV